MSTTSNPNRNNKGYKRTISALLAASLTLGGAGAVFADTSSATSTSTAVTSASAAGAFSDVKAGFWAEKHIFKLAAQGIIVGNNGLFRPGDSVTQQEAVLMALRFMQLDDKVSDTATALPTGFEVSNYYKPYVVLAFQQNLLDKTAEMAESNLKTAWGTRKATREWVAELLIRALGKTADAQAVAGETSGFADDAKISADKRGYINAAIDLGLTNGLSGNLFNPQGEVTRAQLATFISRAESQSNAVYGNTSTGVVTSLTDSQMTVFDGVSSSVYSLGTAAGYFTSTSETAIAKNDIPLYSKVTVIGKNGAASYIEVTDPNPQVETIQGTVAKVSAGSGKLWLKTAEGYPEYTYNAATVFVDKGGNTIDPSTITEDSTVNMIRETFSGQQKVLKVQVTSGVVNKTATGTVKSVDTTTKTIAFTTAAGGEESFQWDSSTWFSYKKEIILPADLQAGSQVSYTIKSNMIQSLEVTGAMERTVEGTLEELGGSSVVYRTSDGTRTVKLLVSSPVVTVPNVAAATVDNLIADPAQGDKVRLTLNASDQVTQITVLAHQYDSYTGASVVSFDSTTGLLTFKDVKGAAHVVTIDSDTDITGFNGSKPTLSNFGWQLGAGVKVNVIAIKDKSLSVAIASFYEGTVQEISASTGTFTLKSADGTSIKLGNPSSVEVFGKTSASMADIAVGDSVKALLASGQSSVSTLKKIQKLQVRISTVNAGAYKLGVTLGSYVSDLYVSGVPVTDENGAEVKLTSLKAGDYLNVDFAGITPLALHAVSLTLGQITNVDTAGSSLTIKDYSGVLHTLSAAGGVQIDRSGTVTASLAGLSLSERAEVRKGADGKLIVSVLTVQTRSFSSYDPATGTLTLKRDSVNDENYRFQLPTNVYIHQGDTTLSVQSLKENDKLTVYFNNNVVVEMVKQ